MAGGWRTKTKCSRGRLAGAGLPARDALSLESRRMHAAWGRRQAGRRAPGGRTRYRELTGERMMNRFTRAALCAALFGGTAIAAAADLLPVEDFARHPSLSMPRLSPDGKYLA